MGRLVCLILFLMNAELMFLYNLKVNVMKCEILLCILLRSESGTYI